MFRFRSVLAFITPALVTSCASIAPGPSGTGKIEGDYHVTGTYFKVGSLYAGQSSSHLHGESSIDGARFSRYRGGGQPGWRWSFHQLDQREQFANYIPTWLPNYWVRIWSDLGKSLDEWLPILPGLNVEVKWIPTELAYEDADGRLMWGSGEIDLELAFHTPAPNSTGRLEVQKNLRTVMHEYFHIAQRLSPSEMNASAREALSYVVSVCSDYFMDGAVDHFVFDDIPEFTTYDRLLASPDFKTISEEFSDAPPTYKGGLLVQFNVIKLVGQPIFSEEHPRAGLFERFCADAVATSHNFLKGYLLPAK